MSTMSRWLGHGMGAFFILLGLGFLILGLSDGFTNWLDANSSCQGGNCGEDSVRSTFIILGVCFVGAGLITSLATEYAIRKTRRLVAHMATFPGLDAPTLESIGGFLEPFGIDLSTAQQANTRVDHRVINLRGQRTGKVPTDPEGLGDYLKSLGVSIDPEVLRSARVVRSDEPAAGSVAAEPAATVVEPRSSDLLRETATIVRKKDRGQTAGDQRLLELELEVTPAGKVPYRVTVASLVRESLTGLLIEGSTLNVRVNPHAPNDVRIDWSEN
ncbi:MAG: hypothetical protein AB7N24_07580 [Dehalococcoidia bacterium]